MTNDTRAILLSFFKVLGDETRLRMLGLLAQGDCTVGELATNLGLRPPTVSHHVGKLKALSLVTVSADGNERMVRLHRAGLEAIARQVHAGQLPKLAADVDPNAWRSAVIRNFVEGTRLKAIPASRKKRSVILEWLAGRFEEGRSYSEREVSQIIAEHHEDFATLRRELVGAKHLSRTREGVYTRPATPRRREGAVPMIPFSLPRPSSTESMEMAKAHFEHMDRRRSVRQFRPDPVPKELVEWAIRTASTAPSGAHRQPWTWVAVSKPELKRQLREAVEAEEKRTYEERMPEAWREALRPIGTDWHKPYLEVVPWVVVLFAQRWGSREKQTTKHYYVTESCGIAAGLFVSALHQVGLSTVTHTPSPMGFLSELLGRPKNEAPLMLFPIGYHGKDAVVPALSRKRLDEVAVFL